MLELFHEIKDYFDITRAKPRSVALGAALAAFLGFVPLKCGLVALILFIIGMTDASGTVAAILAVALKPLSMFVFDDTSVNIGRSLCESDWAKSHAGFFNAPGIALLGLEKYHVTGGAVLGLIAAIPFFIVFYRLQQKLVAIRAKGLDKWKDRKRAKAEEKALKEGKTPEEAKAAGEAAIAPGPEKKRGCIGTVLAIRSKWRAIPLKKWIFLAIVLGSFELFLAKPMLRYILQEKFPDGLAIALGMVDPTTGKVTQRGKVEFDDKTFDFSLVRGALHLEGLQVTNPRNVKENLFTAKTIDAKVTTFALLRRQFLVESVVVDSPLLAVARQEDGTLGIEPAPKTPEAAQEAKSQPQGDWTAKAKSYLDRAKKEMDERKKKQEEAKKAQAEGKKPEEGPKKKVSSLADALERAAEGLPGEDDDLLASKWVVKKVQLSGFAVNLQDPQTRAPSFAFNDGKLLEAAQNRLAHGQATVLSLVGSLVDQGKQAKGKLKLDFTEDAPTPDGKPVGWTLHAEIGDVSLKDTDALFASAVPLTFDAGTATIVVDAKGHGLDGDLDAAPRISFKDVVAKARETNGTIAGMPSTKVAEEVTNCGAFDIDDIHITGSVLAPKVEMGDTIKDLVVQGGKNYAKKKGTEMLNKGLDKGKEQLEKKVPGASEKADEAKKKLEENLPKLPNPFGK
jgi:uncharacterized protein (DUF2062 family)